jgi:signal peptidase II
MNKALYRLLLAAVIGLSVDGSTKAAAERALDPYQPVPIVGQVFRLTLNYNTGVAFSVFADGGRAPLILSGVIIAGLSAWLVHALRAGTLTGAATWPFGLLLGGALGNFADRLYDGRVTDFLDVGLGTARWPTFNLADTLIVVSMVTLIVKMIHQDRTLQAAQ